MDGVCRRLRHMFGLQVKNTTDRVLFEMRFKERAKEEESGQELLNLAVQLKDKETQRRLTQQMALRFEQLRQKRLVELIIWV